MPEQVIRVLSDLHFGDRSSRIGRPQALAPLAEGVEGWIINGDSLDTRPGISPAYTAEIRGQLDGFLQSLGFPVTQLTGNHDPDVSAVHRLEVAAGRVFLTHGDVLYPEIVPWGLDAGEIRALIEAELAAADPPSPARSLDHTLAVFRRVAARIPQRHQSERNAARYLFRLGRDLLSPPWRSLSIFEAWRSFPHRAWRLAEAHGLQAEVIIAGHIHWSGIWRRRQRPTIINTGAFCRPFHALAVDWRGDSLRVRRVAERRGLFYPGSTVAELHLDAPRR